MQDKIIAPVKFIMDALRQHYGFKTYGQLSEFLGVKQNTLSSWISRGSFDRDLVYRKCDGINYKWLETGEGEMFPVTRQPAIGDQAQPVWHPHGTVPAIGAPPTEEEVVQAYFRKMGLIPGIGETVNEEIGKLNKSKQFIATGKILDLLKKIQDEEDGENQK